MNFLAHIYLSGNNDLIKIGNFMADGIRGHDYEQFPIDVQKGILLHRAIDTFTDAHPIFRKSKHRLHEAYGHYSGVIIDILYDHFLAKNWATYSEEKLEDYANKFYQSLRDNYDWLTARTQGMLPSMIGRNWLMSYATLEGISMILFQMDYRTKNRANMQNAMKELQEYYADFETEFTAFFEELRAHAQQKLAIL
nr:acyl carrier protein phosphodiesterase [uncultured Flavobacterium sp.]